MAVGEVFIGTAPGRMDVMGGIADYSGSLLLQMPILQKTTVKLTEIEALKLQVSSKDGDKVLEFEITWDQIQSFENTLSAQKYFSSTDFDWAAYPVGCFILLNLKKLIQPKGFKVEISSEVPLGKGVSSSAALEVATLKAIESAYELSFEGTELPTLAQKVENDIVGAPCGLMDQLASYFGRNGFLTPIKCQPDVVYDSIQIPDEVRFIGLDSGVRHSVGGASYGDVRAAAFMGYSIIAQKLGASIEDLQVAKATKDWSNIPFKGFLGNVSVHEFESEFASLLPKEISGFDFLSKYKLSIDDATAIKDEVVYNVFNATKHPIYENYRVERFKELLENKSEGYLQEMGQLMFQSNESYNDCHLGSDATNELVDLVQDAGLVSNMYGAKITGGGSGGTVVVLCEGKKGVQSVNELFNEYKTRVGKEIILLE